MTDALPPQLGGGATEAEIEAAIDEVAGVLVNVGVGQVMKRLNGRANPSKVVQLLRRRLLSEPREEDAG
jgi:Asp-tRNA(Asn)/Glu-tRNA(Gln) amidotransferase B subunit